MASTGKGFSRRTTSARPSSARRSVGSVKASASDKDAMWLMTICRERSNQKHDSAVSTAPFPGMGSGRTTSKADMRSVVTIKRWASPTA